MARDWIKMRTDLYRDPKVCMIADHLLASDGKLAAHVNQLCQRDMTVTRNVTRNVTVGALVTLWGVMRHRGKRDGDNLVVRGVALEVVDDICDLPGFGDALCEVGWIVADEERLIFPRFFEEYNVEPGESAKENNRERQRRHREKRNALRNVTVTLQSNAREEKSREEKSIPSPSPLPPSSAPPSPASDTERNGDGGGFRDASWTAITKRLVSLGVADVRDVVAVLKENDIEPAVVQATINHYVEKNQWEVGALVWRLKKATPEHRPSDGWPKPQVDKQARARAIASREESRTHQQIDSVRRKLIREHGIKEACDFTDRQIVEKASELGLT